MGASFIGHYTINLHFVREETSLANCNCYKQYSFISLQRLSHSYYTEFALEFLNQRHQ